MSTINSMDWDSSQVPTKESDIEVKRREEIAKIAERDQQPTEQSSSKEFDLRVMSGDSADAREFVSEEEAAQEKAIANDVMDEDLSDLFGLNKLEESHDSKESESRESSPPELEPTQPDQLEKEDKSTDEVTQSDSIPTKLVESVEFAVEESVPFKKVESSPDAKQILVSPDSDYAESLRTLSSKDEINLNNPEEKEAVPVESTEKDLHSSSKEKEELVTPKVSDESIAGNETRLDSSEDEVAGSTESISEESESLLVTSEPTELKDTTASYVVLNKSTSAQLESQEIKSKDITPTVNISKKEKQIFESRVPAYDPFRRGMYSDAMETLRKAAYLQLLDDEIDSTNISLDKAVSFAWKQTAGKFIKGIDNPGKMVESVRVKIDIGKYKGLKTLKDLQEKIIKDISAAKATIKKFSNDDSIPHTLNRGSIAGAMTLLLSVSKNCGCTGVKYNVDVMSLKSSYLVEVSAFAKVYCLFNEQDRAEAFAKGLSDFGCEVIYLDGLKLQKQKDEEESLASTSLLGSDNEDSELKQLKGEKKLEEFDEESDEKSDKDEDYENEKYEDESSIDLPKNYTPFKKNATEFAIQSLKDSRICQLYEDYKAVPRGINATLDQAKTVAGTTFKGIAKVAGGAINLYRGIRGKQPIMQQDMYNRNQIDPYNRNQMNTFGKNQIVTSGDVSYSVAPIGGPVGRFKSWRNEILQDKIADCPSVLEFNKLKNKALSKIPKRLRRRIVRENFQVPAHTFGTGATLAYKTLQLALSRQSGVREVLLGNAGRDGRNGYIVYLYDFAGLRCVFKDQKSAEYFETYMSKFLDVGMNSRNIQPKGYNEYSYGS